MLLQRVVSIISVLLTVGVVASAQDLYQVETRPVRGFMPNMEQLSSPIDHIDPVSGKLHLEIPLASLPRGRAGSGFDLNLVYDSNGYDLFPEMLYPFPPYTQAAPAWRLESQLTSGGWSYSGYRLDIEERSDVDVYDQNCEQSKSRPFRFRIVLDDGSQHTLHLKDYGDFFSDIYQGDGFYGVTPAGKSFPCARRWGWPSQMSGWLTYFTTDGSYLKFETYADGSGLFIGQLWYLYFPDGRRLTGHGVTVEALYDANGNGIHFISTCYDPPPNGNCSQPYRSIVDDSGREIRIDYAINGPQPWWSTRRDRITTQGPNGPMSWTVDWEMLFIGQDQRTYQWSQAEWDPTRPLNFSLLTVKNVQLPLAAAVPVGQTPVVWNSYEFGYSDDDDDGFGQVDFVRTPSGSTYLYRYVLEGLTGLTANDIANYNGVSLRKLIHDGEELTWKYEKSAGQDKTIVTSPDESQTTYWIFPPPQYINGEAGIWTNKLVYRIDEPNGTVRKRVWAPNYARGEIGEGQGFNRNEVNAYIQRETTTVGNAAGLSTLTTVTEKTIDKNSNLLQTIEYDWVPYDPAGPEVGVTVKRTTKNTYYADVPAATNSVFVPDDPESYWSSHFSPLQPTQPRRLNALRRKEIRDSADAIVAVTEFEYDDAYRSGNLTAEKRWDSVKSPASPGPGTLNPGNSQVLTRSYGAYGNLEDIFEPEVPTHITYDSSGSFPEQVIYALGTSAQRSWRYEWNQTAGTLTSKKDLDNDIVTLYSYDVVGRQQSVIEAGVRKTETHYDDENRRITVKKDLFSLGDGKLELTTKYDSLGRPTLTRNSEPGNSDGINVQSLYNVEANRTVQSSPYRTTADPTLEWTCTQKDESGRTTAVAIFKGSAAPTDCESTANRTGITRTAYDANQTTVIDPAGKERREVRDGLGLLTQVIEDPSGLNYSTTYLYDTLGNLTQVNQGVQIRTFQYSSLSRLTSAKNPESGTINYSYKDSGDLLTRTDARNIQTSFSYDPLRRIETKTYSDNTPPVIYSYYLAGSAAPNLGQLKSVDSAAASHQNTSYDALGRVTTSSHTIAGDPTTRNFSYSYWLNDSVKTVTNPSGRVINYDVDDAGRAVKVWSGSRTYADLTVSGTPYTADGRIAQMKLGNNLWETRSYQTPGTPTLFKLGTSQGANDKLELEYNFSATANNGNLQTHVIRQALNTWSQSFSYDGVNRLKAAYEGGGWGRTYGYDPYGNRWVSSSSPILSTDVHEPIAETNFSTITNHLSVAASGFDAAGNQITFVPWTLGYDAENRNSTATSTSIGNGSFLYDGNGRRVKKTWTPYGGSPSSTYYLYNALGQLAAEYSTQMPTAGTLYVHTDLLGSTRMVTSATGAVLECYDYLPFGRMLGSGINSRNNGCYPTNPDTQINSRLPQKFTGKERDSETRLDYFGARYYSAAQGRFTSADAPFADQHPENPQSWNLYQYAYNNPLANVDRDGRSVWTKAIKLLLKGGDIALTVKDVVDDFKTASNVDLPWSTRLLADASILSEVLPISAGDVKDVGRVLGFADKAKDAAQKALKHGDDAADGLRVIGHSSDGYVDLGRDKGAKFFEVDRDIYKSWSRAEQQAANKKFLDRAIRDKAPFLSATHRDKIRKRSPLEWEVEYLLQNGYDWSDDGFSLMWKD